MSEFVQHAALHEQGIATGIASIREDAVHFTFYDEHFTLPTVAALGIARFNGYFYVAKVDDLRRFAERN